MEYILLTVWNPCTFPSHRVDSPKNGEAYTHTHLIRLCWDKLHKRILGLQNLMDVTQVIEFTDFTYIQSCWCLWESDYADLERTTFIHCRQRTAPSHYLAPNKYRMLWCEGPVSQLAHTGTVIRGKWPAIGREGQEERFR